MNLEEKLSIFLSELSNFDYNLEYVFIIKNNVHNFIFDNSIYRWNVEDIDDAIYSIQPKNFYMWVSNWCLESAMNYYEQAVTK